MFKSLKSFIDSRLGRSFVLDDFANDYGYFLKIHHNHLYSVAFFLKNDPDTRLTLLDQIIAFPSQYLAFSDQPADLCFRLQILYQFKSLKLPYRVTLAIDIDKSDSIPSIAPLFLGARWQETDIETMYGLSIEESDRDH